MTAPLKNLEIFDPDLARMVRACAGNLSVEALDRLVTDTLWASSVEPSFGRAVTEGYLELAKNADDEEAATEYHRLVREAGQRGPVFGRLMARHLGPILCARERQLRTGFFEAVEIMLKQGAYTLPGPLEALSKLLNDGEVAAAKATIVLLCAAFSQDLSYVRSQHFAFVLPRAVLSFPPRRRVWQTNQLYRVLRTDPLLVDPFLEGMAAGLHLLGEKALAEFVSQAVEKFEGNLKTAAKHLALSSRAGLDAFRQLQVTVSLAEVRPQLNRYLQARIGGGVSVRCLEDLSAVFRRGPSSELMAVSDGCFIYLPREISSYPSRSQNLTLYKTLTRMEAGHLEFGTFDFDLEKMADEGATALLQGPQKEAGDLQRFFDAFPIPRLAQDLFTAFEHGRIRKCLARRYPGLVRRCLPLLKQEARRASESTAEADPLQALYRLTALGTTVARQGETVPAPIRETVGAICRRFDELITPDSAVETCGLLVREIYADMERLCGNRGGCPTLLPPFGRKFDPDLVFSRQKRHDRSVVKIKSWIEAKGYRVYASDIRRRLMNGNGKLSTEEIRGMLRNGRPEPKALPVGDSGEYGLPELDLSELIRDPSAGIQIVDDAEPDDASGYPVFRYDEWDSDMGDYLKDYVRVCQRPVAEDPNDFYQATLARYQGLVLRMRHAFELLKPEGIKILRRWVEGDEFDYRALLNAALDRKAGLIPSERLYNKRVKQQRDVSVLLLVDLSRSTANRVKGSTASVLDVEKEAIVLFCEALTVVGDDFSIAGFSGTGRLGVDYFTVKAFEEEMGAVVRRRINALAPQRSTRMGAAIRHAVHHLEGSPSRVRLLIVLGDGFPNDVDYKQGYAVADTRRAVFEARSKDVFTHAITVNIAGDPRLDDLYGPVRHTVIADVRELPDKLLRIYGSLTRY